MCYPFSWHICERSFLKRAKDLRRTFWSSAYTGNQRNTALFTWSLLPPHCCLCPTPKTLMVLWGSQHRSSALRTFSLSSVQRKFLYWPGEIFLSMGCSFANKSLLWDLRFSIKPAFSPAYASPQRLYLPSPLELGRRKRKIWGGGNRFNVSKYYLAPFIWKYQFMISNNWSSSETLDLSRT